LDWILPREVKGLNIDIYIMFFAFLIVVGVSMAWASSNKDFMLTVSILLATFFILYVGLVGNVLPKIDKHAQYTLRKFSKSIPIDVEIATYKTIKPSTTFYAKRRVSEIPKYKKLEKKIAQSSQFAFVAKKNDLKNKPLSNVYKWGEDYRYVFYTNYPVGK